MYAYTNLVFTVRARPIALSQFLEVSRFSFVKELGNKYSEGIVEKKGGGMRAKVGLMTLFQVLSTKPVRILCFWRISWLPMHIMNVFLRRNLLAHARK